MADDDALVMSSPMVVGLGLTTLFLKGRSLSSRALYIAAELIAGCCQTLRSVVHSSNVLLSLCSRYLCLSLKERSDVVSFMRSLGYPLLMNHPVSSRAHCA